MLGVTQTFESEWAACSHPGTDAVGHHCLPREDRSEASLPSSTDRHHRVTCPQTNKGPIIIYWQHELADFESQQWRI